MKNLLLIAIAILGFSTVSFGQISKTETVSATAKIITPLTVVKTSDIAFGKILPGLASGTVAISTAISPTRTPDATITCVGNFTNAKFTVGGAASTTYSVNLPSNVSLTGTGPAMLATLSMSANPTLNPIATADFYIGASLAVGTAVVQTAGDYSGTFNVTVSYE